MPGENIETNKTSKTNADDVSYARITKEVHNVDDITGRTCYFSLAGDLAIKVFENLEFSTFAENVKKKKIKRSFYATTEFCNFNVRSCRYALFRSSQK